MAIYANINSKVESVISPRISVLLIVLSHFLT